MCVFLRSFAPPFFCGISGFKAFAQFAGASGENKATNNIAQAQLGVYPNREPRKWVKFLQLPALLAHWLNCSLARAPPTHRISFCANMNI